MARPLRLQYEGALYHVTLRGNERRPIVRDDEDRDRFVEALGASVLRHGVILHLYCLMDNHAHFVVETPLANLSAFMQNFQTRYVVWFNRRQRQGGWERALLAKELVEQAGLTQREAARVMGLTTGAAVSIQLRRLQPALSQEAPLGRQVKQIEARLNNLLFKG
jgi:REP element-mobilizing transposase RayT